MSKKYSPSGYQIINITVPSNVESGSTITASTEDEKLLCKLLSEENKSQKPILLSVYLESDGRAITGIGTVYGNEISLSTFAVNGTLSVGINIVATSEDEFDITFSF